MNVPSDFLAAWRTQLGLSGKGATSRRHKVNFVLAIATGVTDQATLDNLIRNLGLYATGAVELAKATVTHFKNHLSDDPDAAAELRRELGELVPVDERPKA